MVSAQKDNKAADRTMEKEFRVYNITYNKCTILCVTVLAHVTYKKA
jgi:hypothetical protein